MLNKIKIIGEVLPIKIREENERSIDNADSDSQQVTSGFDTNSQLRFNSEREKREPWLFFSLLVTNPNRSSTILRCVAQGENVERIKQEIKEGDLVEVRGYLRNEKDGRQILIKVLEFKKLAADFKIDEKETNQVRLIGKIITDLQEQTANKYNPEILSFKLAVPREGNRLPLFFCRVHGQELITEINEKLKKSDIILLEGFLQTKKVEEGGSEEAEKKISHISAIICCGFTRLDSDSVSVFDPLDNLIRVWKDAKEIDFTKPKVRPQTDE